MSTDNEIRLNKYIAMCGVCSRRDADKLIEDGKITVNGITATQGVKVTASDTVMFDGKVLKMSEDIIVLAYNKPVGVVCTEKDEHAERTIIEDLNIDKRVTYAGRLDKDSEGLMILTNDGDLIQAMMRGANGHEKEYVVEVNHKLTDKFLHELEKGVYLADLERTTKPCKTQKITDTCFKIILTQGLNRQIRRMCDTFGYEVIKLKRIRIMNVELQGLNYSEYRVLEGEELRTLYRGVGLEK
ncbi:pseudouridine synthase [Butyrivibrio sp. WCD3002]|uniref:pseudouridine synthase n=1 Tax=Butyrivibrio sp. WCD3002 TaxID=1280676 RepID=UPI0004019ED4|nr:pseudouridine synthase [Butyrivibrio sp. WCD3002]